MHLNITYLAANAPLWILIYIVGFWIIPSILLFATHRGERILEAFVLIGPIITWLHIIVLSGLLIWSYVSWASHYNKETPKEQKTLFIPHQTQPIQPIPNIFPQ